MNPEDLCFTPATVLRELIRRKELSPVELTATVLDRIERLNPTLNAYCTVTAPEAREAAREAEAAVMRGDELGALHGLPLSVKDLTTTKGVRTARGSKLYEHYVPDEDAPSVARVRAAGAVILGKTNTPEFGWKGDSDNPLFGPTYNPWDRTKTAGGSSGGAAAAVAAGLGPLAIGSDGAGSIRIPASFCGIVGLKAQVWRVAMYPPSATETISHTGPMTRTVRDTALLLGAMAGPDERDRHSLPADGVDYLAACEGGIADVRVAWSPDLGFAAVDPEVAAIAAQAARRFATLGCDLEEVNPGFNDPVDAELTIFYAGVGANIMDLTPERRALIDPGLLRAVDEEMTGKTAFDYARAIVARQAFYDQVRRFFERYELLLTPSIAVPAFPVGEEGPFTVDGRPVRRFGYTPFTYPFNLTGHPAITIPAGYTQGGLPVGLQIVGRRYAEAAVLRAGAAYEDAFPWATRRPPLA